VFFMAGMVQATTKPERALRVLIVDDNHDAADSLGWLVRLWGYDCQVAYDGAAGVAAACGYQPQCLVLDISMPVLDGYAVAQQLHRKPGLENAKFIALTAYSDETHTRWAREAGFDFQLVKPADLKELERLLNMLDEMLRLAGKTEQLARRNAVLAGETKELLQEVKGDLKEVKQDLKEVKQELREVKENKSEGTAGPPGA
jgi:two-component system, OmpR family, response regulator